MKKITRTQLNKFLEAQKTDKKTLDIGCSTSGYAQYFPNRVGLDIVKKEGVDIVGDAHQLPFPDETFENILCTEVLEHLHTPQRAVDEMWRVLKVGGKLILTTRFLYPIHDAPHDYFRYTKYGLSHLLSKWGNVEIIEETDTMGTFGVLFQTVALKSKLRGGKVTKHLFFAAAYIAQRLSWLVTFQSAGSREKPIPESNIMVSGYYVIAQKGVGDGENK